MKSRNFLFFLILIGSKGVFGQMMVADSVAFARATWVRDTLESGLVWEKCHFTEKEIFASNQNINLIRFSRSKKSKLKLELGSAGKKRVLTSRLTDSLGGFVGLNGSFFDMKNGGAVDFIKINDTILDTSRLTKNRLAEHQLAAIALDADGNATILGGGDSTDIGWERAIDLPNVMVTGPLLLMNRVENPLRQVPFNQNRHPRTAFGVTKDDYILLTIDGRTAESNGVSLPELCAVMRWLGCLDAVNLDGGGSTTLFIKGKTPNGVVNMPCDNKKFDHEGERTVSNILMIK